MITILFLSANPSETVQLEVIKECNIIDQKLRSSAEKGTFELKQRHDISNILLIEELQYHNPQIIHFSGHGSEKSALLFKNENTDQTEEVPPSALSDIFKVLGTKIDLVFLNACYSEKQAKSIAEHVNCVIGMSDAIPDDTAIEFASTFYSSLGFGRNIKEAFDLAMAQLGLLSMSGDKIPKLIVKEGMDTSKISLEAKESEPSSQLNNGIISNNNLSMDKQEQHQIEGTPNNGNITVGNITGGTGIIIGKDITTGNVIIGIDQSIKQNPQNEYLQGLKKLTKNLEKEYEKNNVSEQKRTEINKSIQDLQNEVKDLKPETKVEDIKDDKQKEIKNKTETLYQKIIDATPQAAEIIVNLTPLAPFSKFFKNGIQNAVDAYKKYKESQS
jgi:hypothetical protein